ncbi:MAG: hypothetical protein Q4C01_00380 [Clostridia bacterium]|nr:hypothetical protein [Clostridia bacterium]
MNYISPKAIDIKKICSDLHIKLKKTNLPNGLVAKTEISEGITQISVSDRLCEADRRYAIAIELSYLARYGFAPPYIHLQFSFAPIEPSILIAADTLICPPEIANYYKADKSEPLAAYALRVSEACGIPYARAKCYIERNS